MTLLHTSKNRRGQLQHWFLIAGAEFFYVVLLEQRGSRRVCPSLYRVRFDGYIPYFRYTSKRTKEARSVIAECKRTTVRGKDGVKYGGR